MMCWRRLKRGIARWLVPQGIIEAIRLPAWTRIAPTAMAVVSKNVALRKAHEGQRCFILGTGPSINTQDILPLRTEMCIVLNAFYHHKDYHLIAPRYHLFSGLCLHPHIIKEAGLAWYRDLRDRTCSATLLLNYGDKEFIEGNHLLPGRSIFYLHYQRPWELLDTRGIDAAQSLYPSQNVAAMAIQAALYMGCSDIILLGLDHDWVLRKAAGRHTQFFQPEDGRPEPAWEVSDWTQIVSTYLKLWNQYRRLRRFAEGNGIRILNATKGGMLDVFPRVELEDVVSRGPKVGG